MKSYFIFKFGIALILTFYIILLVKFHSNSSDKTSKSFFVSSNLKKHTKWIVVTSINNPTKQIARLANQIEFKLLVIADQKTNSKWKHPNATFISLTQQKISTLKSILNTPFNSYTRKNIGYLIAIESGARFIYDTDDDNEPIIDLIDYFNYGQLNHELEYDSKLLQPLNPFAHFGQPTIWPRGFPLNSIKNEIHNVYSLAYKKTSIVQQGLHFENDES
jgi:hypothetical protein